MQVLSKPLGLNLAAGTWLPFRCPECGLSRLALVPTVDGAFDAENCSIVWALGCRVEFSFEEIRAPEMSPWFKGCREVR